MRKSKAEAAETRLRIVEAAACEFRRNGIQATGLADVMSAAGLTHGGFYRHFGSKDELIAEASTAGMESILERVGTAANGAEGADGFEAIIGAYLAPDHRDDPAKGCPLAGLGSELARADGETGEVVSTAIAKFIELIAEQMPRRGTETANSKAMLVLSAMVGAVTLARIATDSELSEAILLETKRQLLTS